MPFPLSTLATTVGAAGITGPSYADILTSLQTSFKIIYGKDVYLGADTQDGQMLAIIAQAIYDQNQSAIATYNQFSPATAQGVGLSSIVKINGIARQSASFSTATLLLGGTVGTVILNGLAGDTSGNAWALPASVTIPVGGSISVTATCQTIGAIPAAAGAISTINTPVLGWSTVTNLAAASVGAPVETDAALRIRQAQSVSLPALTVLAATVAAVKAVPGVTQVAAYENDTDVVDANGQPAHSIAIVVSGGDVNAIANAIMVKKTPGCYTHGTTSIFVVDSVGVTHQIRFFLPTATPIKVAVSIKALQGYVAATGVAVQQAIVDYINGLNIGQSIYLSRLYLPAQLNGSGAFGQFELLSLQIAISPGVPASSDIVIPYTSEATCQLSDVALSVS